MTDLHKVKCSCSDGYTSRKLTDPNCCAHNCDYNDAVDEIGKLTAERETIKAELTAAIEQQHLLITMLERQDRELTAERDALKAQVEQLRTEINGIVADSAGVAGYHLNGDVAFWDEFDLLEMLDKYPAQCLAERDAEVATNAFIAGVNATGQGYNGEHGLSQDEIIDLAKLYLERKLQQASK